MTVPLPGRKFLDEGATVATAYHVRRSPDFTVGFAEVLTVLADEGQIVLAERIAFFFRRRRDVVNEALAREGETELHVVLRVQNVDVPELVNGMTDEALYAGSDQRHVPNVVLADQCDTLRRHVPPVFQVLFDQREVPGFCCFQGLFEYRQTVLMLGARLFDLARP